MRMAARWVGQVLVLGMVVAGALFGVSGVSAAGPAVARPAVSVLTSGYDGTSSISYSGVANPPTSDKPQSKLWWNDGSWWADMWTTGRGWEIRRLDRSTETWVDTGILTDTRGTTLADVLWDGTHLYVASHVVGVSTNETPVASVPGQPAYLYRYSYSGGTYTLDSGFPTTITVNSSESMTIDKDSNGYLWTTWTQVSGSGSTATNTVYVNDSPDGGVTWNTPFVIPATDPNPSPDDISAVVAFGGTTIGVMWSDQTSGTVYWATHPDSADSTPNQSWNVQSALAGKSMADDHLNLKTLQADSTGRVFAAVKTSVNDTSIDPTLPQLLMLVFTPSSMTFSVAPIATTGDCVTRPQVVLDTQNNLIHVFLTAPAAAVTSCANSASAYSGVAGTIYEKTAAMSNPSFGPGRGTAVIQDAASPNMNNVTTTKQSVNSATGLVVMASDDVAKRYWFADEPLSPPATGPTGLTATAGTGSVDLSWTADSTAGGPSVTGYDIYRGISAGAESSTPVASNVSGTSFTDTTVADGATYYYTVAAVNAAGASPHSGEASATTPAATVAGAPTGVTATAGAGSVSVSWSAPSSDGGSAITGYQVYRGTTAGGESSAPIAGNVSGTSFTDTTVADGATYYYTVAAVNAAGASPHSGEASATTPAAPVAGPPTGLTATAGSGSVGLSWSAPSSTGGSAITGYQVYRGSSAGGESSTPIASNVSGTGFTDTTVRGGKTYFYQVAAVTSAGTSPASNEASATPQSAAGSYVAVGPVRVLDTRTGTGTGGVRSPVSTGATLSVPVAGNGLPAPAGASAVAINVTVTAPTAAGYLTAYAGGGAIRPAVSNLNFLKGQTVPNLVVVPVAADGTIKLYNGSAGSVHMIGDIAGYYTAGAPTMDGTFGSVGPARVLDTRTGTGTGGVRSAVAAQGTVSVKVTGINTVPTGVKSVVVNVTVTQPTADGYVTAYAGGGAARPTVSNLNFAKGETVPNLVVVPVGSDGTIKLFNGSGGTVHLVADIAGYYLAGPTGPVYGGFGSVGPVRVLDTRTGIGTNGSTSAVAAGGIVSVKVTGLNKVPAAGVSAVVVNMTVTQPATGGYLTAYAGSSRPAVSNLNFSTGQTVPNLAVVPVAPDGTITLYNGSGGTAHVVADIAGYFLAP